MYQLSRVSFKLLMASVNWVWISKWDKFCHWKINEWIGRKERKKKEVDIKLLIHCEWFRLAANYAESEVVSHSVGWSDTEIEVPDFCSFSVETTRYRIHGVCFLFNDQQVGSRGDASDLHLEVVRLESRSGRWLISWMLIVAFRSVCCEREPKYWYRFVQWSTWLLTWVFIYILFYYAAINNEIIELLTKCFSF
jgi:hypothetical protein